MVSLTKPKPGRRRALGDIHEPGIYRIRHLVRDGLTYIGQTGRSLRGRLHALAGCYDEASTECRPESVGNLFETSIEQNRQF